MSGEQLTGVRKFYPLDVLICATGFGTSYLPHFPIIGDQGKSLAEQWKDEVQAYLGIAVPHFQNYLSLLGPNCPVGNGPILIAVEHQASYITQIAIQISKRECPLLRSLIKSHGEFQRLEGQITWIIRSGQMGAGAGIRIGKPAIESRHYGPARHCTISKPSRNPV